MKTLAVAIALCGAALLPASHGFAQKTSPRAKKVAANPMVVQALEDFRRTTILYQLKYDFNREKLTRADPEQLALYPFPAAWPGLLTEVARDARAYRIIGANQTALDEQSTSPAPLSIAVLSPLTTGIVPGTRPASLLLLGGVSKKGGVVAINSASVYVRGEMAGLLNLQSYGTTVVRGDLSGTLYCGSYANAAVQGKTTGRIVLSNSTNLFLLGGLSGELITSRGAKVFIGGCTDNAALTKIRGEGKVFLESSDLKPGSYTRGDAEIVVLGSADAAADATMTDNSAITPTVPRHLKPFPDPGEELPPQDDRRADGNPDMRYALIKPKAGMPVPAGGYKLLLVLPGGEGSPDFNPFIRRIAANALPPGYIVAELVAPVWTDRQAKQLVWPTAKATVSQAKFTTEQFIRAVVKEVAGAYPVNGKAVYALGWSSGGPPVYASLLEENSPLAGAFVAMSIFHPDDLPPLADAKGKAVYLLHSPQDFIKIAQAETARDKLAQNGAKTTLTTYKGGHGWQEDPFGHILKGIQWLETSTIATP